MGGIQYLNCPFFTDTLKYISILKVIFTVELRYFLKLVKIILINTVCRNNQFSFAFCLNCDCTFHVI